MTNKSLTGPSRFDYILLILLLALMLVMQLSSCTTVRHTVPTDDDLAGCQMVFERSFVLSDDVTFPDPFMEPPYRPISDTLRASACDHVYVLIGTPARDSFYTYEIPDIIYNDMVQCRTVQIIANNQCICIYCHHLSKCF